MPSFEFFLHEKFVQDRNKGFYETFDEWYENLDGSQIISYAEEWGKDELQQAEENLKRRA